VLHQAYIKVNEEGSEAAAATGVVVGTTSVPVRKEITADRPFLFLIRDNTTGSILFLGRVSNPNK
jgi:serpin B